MSVKAWKLLQSVPVLRTPFFKLRRDTCRLPNGREIDDYYVLEEPDIGTMFALTPQRGLVMVEQYKHGIGQVCLELPGGMFEDTDAPPLEQARREFNEETGYDAERFLHIGTFIHNPARYRNRVHHFAALDARPVTQQHLDPLEDITVHLVPINTVFEKIHAGEIDAVATVAAIYLSWDKLRRDGLVS